MGRILKICHLKAMSQYRCKLAPANLSHGDGDFLGIFGALVYDLLHGFKHGIAQNTVTAIYDGMRDAHKANIDRKLHLFKSQRQTELQYFPRSNNVRGNTNTANITAKSCINSR